MRGDTSFFGTQWSKIFYRGGAVQDLNNFYYNGNFQDIMITNISSTDYSKPKTDAKSSFGYLLRNLETEEFR